MNPTLFAKPAGCLLAMLACLSVGCRKEAPVSRHDPSPPSETVQTPDEGWIAMESLEAGKWQGIESAEEIEWDSNEGTLRIGLGNDLNGVRWEGTVPTVPYVVEWEARRLSGSDFFCGLTFPVRSGKEHVSLILGGWGGSLVGISSIDGMDASENSTATIMEFEDQRWYRFRLEVREEHLQAWIDGQQLVDAHTDGLRLSLRPGPIESCAPFGIATWQTKGEIRHMRWRGWKE